MKIPCTACGRVDPKTCSRQECPYFIQSKKTFKKDFSGKAPNIFVGSYGYPNVRMGMLAAEEYNGNDDPKGWSKNEIRIPEIVDARASLINSQFLGNVRSFSDKFTEQAQLVAQSSAPADMEVSLDKAPSYSVSYPTGSRPHGATVKLIDSRLTENVNIPGAVDKAVSDTDLKATNAIEQLYGRIDEYALQKLLTGGLLGIGASRKIVPTKWSITAVDDTISKQKLTTVRGLPINDTIQVYFGGHYGNHFAIVFFARPWQYELFEFMEGNKGKNCTDYESYDGRKNYASETAGGYYATRLPIVEKQIALKKQSAALVLRFITSEYTNPLGVWVVREAVRKALDRKPLLFESEELAFAYLVARSHQFGIPYDQEVKSNSLLLKSFQQRSMFDF